MKKVFISGTAGFIGFHLAKTLLSEGFTVFGYDSLSNYYDVQLKKDRHSILHGNKNFQSIIGNIEDEKTLTACIDKFNPDVVVHLAAQAGVRYSIDNPRAYLNTNIHGTFNVMEAARLVGVKHLMMASTSSVYGANSKMPFFEYEKADTPMSFYAASKKATEAMAHSYAHIYQIPITMFRFFSVYGPWGRPDMALFKFTKAIMSGNPINVYNNGNMWRDFTYVEDLARSIILLMDKTPRVGEPVSKKDSLSEVAPFRVVNIGNSKKVRLEDFIIAIENSLGCKATRNYMDMQQGDVPATWANADLLQKLTGYTPDTEVNEGVFAFVKWFRDYYHAESD